MSKSLNKSLNLSLNLSLNKALLAGVTMAAISSMAHAKPNDLLTLSADAPTKVKASFEDWVNGKSLRGRKDKCYGIALTAENDCKAGAGTSCAGTSTSNFQGNAWTYAPKGSCKYIITPNGPASLSAV